MAISDLLWACPECRTVGAIGADGKCRCGAAFRRLRGSLVEARFSDGRTAVRSPAEWVDRLPSIQALLSAPEARHGQVIRKATAIARESTETEPVRSRGRFLNRVERYGPKRKAMLEMRRDGLIFQPEGEDPRWWPFDALTAVQTSSSTLQVKLRHLGLFSFRFDHDSIFLWESLLCAGLRDFYRRTGRGEIAEFQPRIVTRR